MTHRITTLPGDGLGPEILAPALEVLSAVGEFEFEEHLFVGASIDAHWTALTDEVLAACRQSDAVLTCSLCGS
jgi:3-isopropylmalate dehydrogenase